MHITYFAHISMHIVLSIKLVLNAPVSGRCILVTLYSSRSRFVVGLLLFCVCVCVCVCVMLLLLVFC